MFMLKDHEKLNNLVYTFKSICEYSLRIAFTINRRFLFGTLMVDDRIGFVHDFDDR